MVAFKLFSALALILLSVDALPYLNPKWQIQTSVFRAFNLVTQVSQGNQSFNHLQLVGVHSGAAQNLPSLVSWNQGNFSVGGYVLNNTYVDINFTPPSPQIYSLGLSNGISDLSIFGIKGDANEGTNLNGNAGQQTPGFVIDGGFLHYRGDLPFETFTVCGGIELFGPGTLNALFWRNTTSTPNLEQCADVKLLVQCP